MGAAVSPGRGGGWAPIRDLGSGPALSRCPVTAAVWVLGRGFVLPSRSGPAGALQHCQSGVVSAGVSSVAICTGCGSVGREEADVVRETSVEGPERGLSTARRRLRGYAGYSSARFPGKWRGLWERKRGLILPCASFLWPRRGNGGSRVWSCQRRRAGGCRLRGFRGSVRGAVGLQDALGSSKDR
ncbi:hypothetical protein Nmel_018518 [Mimus melanotis]